MGERTRRREEEERLLENQHRDATRGVPDDQGQRAEQRRLEFEKQRKEANEERTRRCEEEEGLLENQLRDATRGVPDDQRQRAKSTAASQPSEPAVPSEAQQRRLESEMRQKKADEERMRQEAERRREEEKRLREKLRREAVRGGPDDQRQKAAPQPTLEQSSQPQLSSVKKIAKSSKESSFSIHLDKRDGRSLGINVDIDELSLIIEEIVPGLIMDWNIANPKDAVMEGDSIVEVNGMARAPDMVDQLKQNQLINARILRDRRAIT